jgi:hypothetical protein
LPAHHDYGTKFRNRQVAERAGNGRRFRNRRPEKLMQKVDLSHFGQTVAFFTSIVLGVVTEDRPQRLMYGLKSFSCFLALVSIGWLMRLGHG